MQNASLSKLTAEGKKAEEEAELRAQLEELPQIKERSGADRTAPKGVGSGVVANPCFRRAASGVVWPGRAGCSRRYSSCLGGTHGGVRLALVRTPLGYSAAVLAAERLGLPAPEFVPSDDEDDSPAP